MSFFGFDTTLPRDRHSGGGGGARGGGGGGKKNKTTEDIEVYTWGEERYDGLGDGLEEQGDDFNDDTFGIAPDKVGKDFDFSSTPGFGPDAGAASGPGGRQQGGGGKNSTGSAAGAGKGSKNASAFASSLEDLWAMPPFGGSSGGFFGAPAPAVQTKKAEPAHVAASQQPTPAASSPAPVQPSAPPGALNQDCAAHSHKCHLLTSPTHSRVTAPRSLAEIEAELLAGRSGPQQAQATPPQQLQQLFPFGQGLPPAAPQQQQGGARPAMTLAEVEAQMLARRTGTPTATPPHVPAQISHQQQGSQSGIPGLAALLGQQPMGAPVPPSGLAMLPQAPPQPLPASISATLQSAPSGQTVTAQQRVAAHIASMHALLNALPPHVRGAVLALPPALHFEALQDVVRQYPSLLAASRPGSNVEGGQPVDPPNEAVQQEAVRYMMERAAHRVEQEERAEAKRRVRMAKIHSMVRSVSAVAKGRSKLMSALLPLQSSHNNIMTNSDKDFITRIQVSQLVTNDPYSDDFYAHIYFAIRGNPNRPAALGAAPAGGNAKGGKRKTRQLTRRENAMLRMQQQVQRLVENRKERLEKLAAGQPVTSEVAPASSSAAPTAAGGNKSPAEGTSTPTSASATQTATLAGALGRISLGTAKNPKQMLSISPDALKSSAGMANDAVRQALQGASLDGSASTMSQQPIGPDGKRAPLSTYQVLSILEKLYDLVMSLEQRRRDVPAPTAPAADLKAAAAKKENEDGAAAGDEGADEASDLASATAKWQADQDALTATLWKELRVLEPLDISDPHPFVSILSTVKGKRFLPRALRHLSSEQTLTVLTMVVASFQTLDVVREAAALDAVPAHAVNAEPVVRARENLERQTEAFSSSIVPSMLSLMATAPLKIVSGMIALFVERNDVIRVARTRPGVAFLTIFLSRAETLKQNGAAAATSGTDGATPETPATSPEDLKQWGEIFNLLFHRLSSPGVLPSLFPSARLAESTPFGLATGAGIGSVSSAADEADEPVWNLTAALAVSASMEQQQVLVQELREKILENIFAAREVARRRQAAQGQLPAAGGEGEIDASDVRIRNVNLLLHALNLDATQITI
ncbi:DNA topoisomerase 2-associated protein pat1 [Tilletia horrida]|uniref:DNA topoisomerase 2-associated protein pat1 n=1 Tax=Tilletia horrida TaxID=155126 RepID=A0AAN6G8L5_9BASI|nr:DNA topoisomerase 2-associated protein pat1 [Tilletia horrida]